MSIDFLKLINPEIKKTRSFTLTFKFGYAYEKDRTLRCWYLSYKYYSFSNNYRMMVDSGSRVYRTDEFHIGSIQINFRIGFLN